MIRRTAPEVKALAWASLVVAVGVWLIVLASCAGYQVEPYAGVGYRDEAFSDGLRTDDYDGVVYTIGFRYAPPVRIAEDQLFRLTPHQFAPPASTTINIPDAPVKKSELEGLADLGKDSAGNWTPWGAAVVIAIVLLWRELRRPNTKQTKSLP